MTRLAQSNPLFSIFELELELILSQMAQKPMLRGEVGARALRVRSDVRGHFDFRLSGISGCKQSVHHARFKVTPTWIATTTSDKSPKEHLGMYSPGMCSSRIHRV